MHPIKYLWATRAVVYKMTFGRVGNMTYIGRPTFIEGRKNIYIGNRVRIFPVFVWKLLEMEQLK